MYYKTSRVPCIQQDIVTGYKHNSVRMRRAAAARMRCDSCITAHPCRRGVQRAGLTCSSNRVMTAWTHSTGFCAAMAAHACTSAAADDDGEDDDDDEVEEERTLFRGLRPLRSSIHSALRAERGTARYSVWSVSEGAACRHDSARKFESSDPAKQQRCRWEMKTRVRMRSRERARERERERDCFSFFLLLLSLCL